MKLCCICKQPMDADVAFAKLHNICRTCLESGQDTECLNNPSVELSEWEKQHIRQCTECKKYFVLLWHAGTRCGVCSKPARDKLKKEELLLEIKAIAKDTHIMLRKWKHDQHVITFLKTPHLFLKEHAEKVNGRASCINQITLKRVQNHFLAQPFDMEAFCAFISGKIQKNLTLDVYDILVKFYIEGYSIELIAFYHNTTIHRIRAIIDKARMMSWNPKCRWLYKSVQRRPKEEKQQELNGRIADIIESQSRIDLTGTKE